MFRVVLLIVAVAAGGAAAWVTLAVRGRPAIATLAPAAPPVAEKVLEILVVSADLARGQVLNKENMRWQPWPESGANPAYITRSARADALETLTGSLARSRMATGEPIRQELLIPPQSGFLSATLPSGKRAVAVRISAETTAGGFILPLDRVDVISTIVDESRDEGKKIHVSRTILSNVPVLAIDQSVDDKRKDEKPNEEKSSSESKAKAALVGKTATLEVDPTQAEILAAGEAMGTLSLALRAVADNAELAPVRVQQRANTTVIVLRGGRGEAHQERAVR